MSNKSKPQRRKFTNDSPYAQYDKGYNHACMDWEDWLKSSQFDLEKILPEERLIAEIRKIYWLLKKLSRPNNLEKEILEICERVLKADKGEF